MSWSIVSLSFLGLIILVALGVVVGYSASSRSQARAWERIAAARRELWKQESALVDRRPLATGDAVASGQLSVGPEDGRELEVSEYALSGGAIDRYWAVERRPRRSSLLLKLAEIETEAGRVLDEQIGPARRQVFQIREELQKLGIWTQSDVAVFDRAMKVRNSIVHGDSHSQESDAGVSDADLSRLLEKLTKDGRV